MVQLLCSCALRYDGKYDWDEAWREGYVVKVRSDAVPNARGGCLRRVPAPTGTSLRYAEVRYTNEARWTRHQTVPIPEGADVKEGDRVYFNINDCSDGLVLARPRGSQ